MAEQVLVPRDLLTEIEGASARHKRLLVTGWVLGYEQRDPLPALHRASEWWATARLERAGRSLSVLSVLLELETLGICSNVGVKDAEFFTVDVAGEKETAA